LTAHALRLKAQREASSILESRQELSELVVADAKGTDIAPLKNQPMTLHVEGLIPRVMKSP
jgi:hypothetical protein